MKQKQEKKDFLVIMMIIIVPLAFVLSMPTLYRYLHNQDQIIPTFQQKVENNSYAQKYECTFQEKQTDKTIYYTYLYIMDDFTNVETIQTTTQYQYHQLETYEKEKQKQTNPEIKYQDETLSYSFTTIQSIHQMEKDFPIAFSNLLKYTKEKGYQCTPK